MRYGDIISTSQSRSRYDVVLAVSMNPSLTPESFDEQTVKNCEDWEQENILMFKISENCQNWKQEFEKNVFNYCDLQ